MSKNKNYMVIMVALVAMLLMILPVSATSVVVGRNITAGATVFLGEEGLNISHAVGDYNRIGFWGSGANIDESAPISIPVSQSKTSFSISQSDFGNYIGNWYKLDDSMKQKGLAFTVVDPVIMLSIRNAVNDASIDGKTIVAGSNVKFKVETNIRLDSKRGDIVSVEYAPVANFTATINGITKNVSFIDTSSNNPTSWLWNFGDGAINTSQNPIHTYALDGVYTVTLTTRNAVNSAGGIPSVRTAIVTINKQEYTGSVTIGIPTNAVPTPAPYSRFSGVVLTDGSIKFTDLSTGEPDTWRWDFGDGNISIYSVSTNPSHKYSVVNTYTVTLDTTNTANSSGVHSIDSALVTINAPSYVNSVSGYSSAIIPDPSQSVTTGFDTSKGYINIIMKTEGGSIYSGLQTSSGIVSLQNLFINSTPYYWGNGAKWQTGAFGSNGQRMYQNGIYSVYAECNLNGMKENYKTGGAYYTGKTVSSTMTVILGSDSLSVVTNKDSVVRGKSFAVTLTGSPETDYKLFIKGMPVNAPMINDYQDGINVVNSSYAIVKTDNSGSRIVEFLTSNSTKDQKYTIRAESITDSINQKKTDEITINIIKGGLTLVASGDQNYFLGEEIKLSGTNSETETTYFFIVGPNLNSDGAGLNQPRVAVHNGAFVETDVASEDTFSYDWATSQIDLDAGTYTIYAVSQPVDKSGLQDVSYATVSVVIKKPYVSARASQSTIAKGDKIFIEGDAQGNPSSGVAVWILGKNYAKRYTQSVESDSTYKYEIPGAETSSMASGQYFIVVQHPMQNDRFDININGEYVENAELGSSGTTIFKLYGSGSLQGSDAAEALIQAISDPNVDDTYTKLTIIVSEPLITISSIGDRHVGDKFNITGKTNLAVDDEILMEVYSSSFKPTQKVQSGEFSGATGNIKVKKGEDGMNTFSFDVDASTFKVDEYIVVAQSIVQGATGTTLFNVVEGASTNPVVTPVAPVVTAPPVIVTAPPTVPPTAPPTPIPTTIVPTTTKSPGFGAVFALIGLGAVAFMVVRRE